MSQRNLRAIIRASGLLESVAPRETIRQEQALRQVVDPLGTLHRDAVRPYLPHARFSFHVRGELTAGAVSGWEMTTNAGTIIRVAAHIESPAPSNCVVEVRDTSNDVLATVTIPAGETTGESAGLTVPVNGGAWLGISIREAGGASDLSLVVIEKAG
jgi:hypothetical protein